MGSSGPRVAEGTQGKLKMARTLSKISLLLIPLLCMGSSIEAKNWRYWPNIGCFEFSFERTVFFELTNEATRLSAIAGSELPAIVNTSVVPASDNDLQLQHILAGSIKNSTTNRPEECIISCNATGFVYAGLQDGNRCVCMNEPPTAKADGNCNTPCPGNANFTCGGSWSMDLHQNPAYHSTNLTYIGCFKNTFNDLDRMLFEGTYNNFRNNTPDWCVAYCTSGGFDYAGLQYGSQCICTNSGPQGTSDAGQCTYGCAGDNDIKMCGGLGYINIFHTDAHKTTIDDWGCGNTVQDTYYQKWYNDMGHCGVTPGGNGGNGGTAATLNTNGPFIMTAGGEQSRRRISFGSLNSSIPLPDCLKDGNGGGNSVLPSDRNQNPAVFTSPVDGLPIICAGSQTDSSCIKWKNNPGAVGHTYETVGNMIYASDRTAHDFRPDVGLILAGGRNNSGLMKRVEISKDYGATFQELEPLPVARERACVTIVDEKTFYVMGGQGKNDVYSYDLDTNTWTSKPNMPQGRNYGMDCATIDTGLGNGKEIWVAGGQSDTTHVFNLGTQQWRTGPKLLRRIGGAPLVPFQNTLIVAQGWGGGERMQKLDVTDGVEKFVEMAERVTYGAYLNHGVTLIEEPENCATI